MSTRTGASPLARRWLSRPAIGIALLVTCFTLPAGASPASGAPGATTSTLPASTTQTHVLPGLDSAFRARLSTLVAAIASGRAPGADDAFFPLRAYLVVKGISDPVHDYETRLIPDYHADIETLHRALHGRSGAARLLSVHIPNDATWVLPDVEYNRGSYWRVYGIVVDYLVGTSPASFTIASTISWRGEWYVVHLSSFR